MSDSRVDDDEHVSMPDPDKGYWVVTPADLREGDYHTLDDLPDED